MEFCTTENAAISRVTRSGYYRLRKTWKIRKKHLFTTDFCVFHAFSGFQKIHLWYTLESMH